MTDPIIFGVPASSVYSMMGCAAFGFAVHVLFKLAELRDADPRASLTRYFGRNPYRTAGKFLAVIAAGVGMAQPEITLQIAAGAVGIGYAADSAFNPRKQ